MPLRIWRILTLLGRPPGLAGGINGSRMAHSASERSLAYGFIGEDLLTFHFFCLDLLLLYHISPSRLLLFKRLPWPFRTAFKFTSQVCSGCGQVLNKDLSERWHTCDCGTELDRDVNAAINILERGRR